MRASSACDRYICRTVSVGTYGAHARRLDPRPHPHPEPHPDAHSSTIRPIFQLQRFSLPPDASCLQSDSGPRRLHISSLNRTHLDRFHVSDGEGRRPPRRPISDRSVTDVRQPSCVASIQVASSFRIEWQ